MENPTIGRFLKRIEKEFNALKKQKMTENFGENLERKFHDDVNKTDLPYNEKSRMHLAYLDMLNRFPL